MRIDEVLIGAEHDQSALHSLLHAFDNLQS